MAKMNKNDENNLMQKKVAIFAGNNCAKDKEVLYYGLARETGKCLAESGFAIVTGAGEGLMEEAARGTSEAGGKVIGLGLSVINGTKQERSANLHEYSAFSNLKERQDKLISFGDAYVALPGGIGTVYEALEILALKRLNEISKLKPLVFVGEYYDPVAELMRHMIAEGFLEQDATELCYFAPGPVAAVEYIKARI